MYTNCKHKNEWEKLKQELEDAFEDPEIRQNWKTNLAAYRWDGVQPLHVFKGNIIRLVCKYDSDLKVSPKALESAYYSRFHAGLPEDYQGFIEQQLYDDKQTIEHAVRSAQRFQACKRKQKGKQSKEVSAAVTFENDFHGRLRALEQGIERINAHLDSGTSTSPDRDHFPSRDRQLNGNCFSSRDWSPGDDRYSNRERCASDEWHHSGNHFSSGGCYSSSEGASSLY